MRPLSYGTLTGASCLLLLAFGGFENAESQQVTGTNPIGRVIYPASDQTPEQQKQDEQECYTWSSQQMGGWDPIAEYQKANQAVGGEAAAAQSAQGGAVRGAAGGAVAGVAIGAIAGDAGKGAAIGAVAGGLVGGRRSRKQASQAEAEAQKIADQFNASLSQWDRGYTACLQGRGYTVS